MISEIIKYVVRELSFVLILFIISLSLVGFIGFFAAVKFGLIVTCK